LLLVCDLLLPEGVILEDLRSVLGIYTAREDVVERELRREHVSQDVVRLFRIAAVMQTIQYMNLVQAESDAFRIPSRSCVEHAMAYETNARQTTPYTCSLLGLGLILIGLGFVAQF
jgi:hypothetical protein